MPPPRIVEALDVVEQIRPGGISGPVNFAVAAVVDLFSRRVVGWAMKAEMTAQLVTDALIVAIWRRGKPDSLDQGSQYTSEQFQRLMADHGITCSNGITCSMSRSGNVWDNAAMESFFSSLKTERTVRVEPTFRGPDIGEVGDPFLVRSRCLEGAVEEVSDTAVRSPVSFGSPRRRGRARVVISPKGITCSRLA